MKFNFKTVNTLKSKTYIKIIYLVYWQKSAEYLHAKESILLNSQVIIRKVNFIANFLYSSKFAKISTNALLVPYQFFSSSKLLLSLIR